MDIRKEHHHCIVIVINPESERLLPRRVLNDEAALLELIEDALALDTDVLWAVELNHCGAALLIRLLLSHDQPMVYVTGLIVHRVLASYRGEGKTDAKDTFVIADQARMRRDLGLIRPGDEIAIGLRTLTGRRTDLMWVGAFDRGSVEWVQDGLTDPDVLRQAATSAHPLLRRTAAQSPHLPPDLVRLLARTEDPLVEDFLSVHHPDTPEEVLMRVHARLGGTFSAWMAETHPRFPREGLATRHANHPDGKYRRLAVRDPAATPALIERLSHDPAVWTRQAAASDPRLPLHRLCEALHIREPASSAGANSALPEDEMAAVLNRAGVPT
ncbi:IS110 family transposase [Streptomyces noursei]|uniref:IS110 family transposase n=1 Tax=Streptomyces noursei TaxID=1971 RepID=UPI0036D3FD43